MKIRPEVAELFHADGRTDMTKLIRAFRTFANAREKDGMCETHRLNVMVFHAFARDIPYITFRLL